MTDDYSLSGANNTVSINIHQIIIGIIKFIREPIILCTSCSTVSKHEPHYDLSSEQNYDLILGVSLKCLNCFIYRNKEYVELPKIDMDLETIVVKKLINILNSYDWKHQRVTTELIQNLFTFITNKINAEPYILHALSDYIYKTHIDPLKINIEDIRHDIIKYRDDIVAQLKNEITQFKLIY